MKNSKITYVRQSISHVIIGFVSKLLKKISFIKTNPKLEKNMDTWYGIETADDGPFRWSQPVAKLNIKNLNTIVLCFSDPIGREVSFISKGINETIKLDPEKVYRVKLSVRNSEEVVIRTEPFNPEKDTRSLGLQYYYITSDDVLVVN